MGAGALVALFKATACVFAGVAVAARLPRVVRRGRLDVVWVGTVLAAVAFSANPFMISERALDAWLGGTNVFHLLRNLLALSAIWCLRVALVQLLQDRRWNRSRLLREAAVGATFLLGLTAAFLAIDRGPTTGAFIPDHLDQGATVLYTGLIMAMGGWNAADVARVAYRELVRLGNGRDRLLRPALLGLICGAGLLALGCALEAIYVALGHLSTLRPVTEALRSSFGPVFMPGAALVCLAVAWLGAYAQVRRLQVGVRMDIMRIAPIFRQVRADRWSPNERHPGWSSALSDSPQRALYTAVIAIEDTLRADAVSLSRQQRRALEDAERRFELTS
jgi:hypothetical protein